LEKNKKKKLQLPWTASIDCTQLDQGRRERHPRQMMVGYNHWRVKNISFSLLVSTGKWKFPLQKALPHIHNGLYGRTDGSFVNNAPDDFVSMAFNDLCADTQTKHLVFGQ
jgi:hypothetical protein